MKFLSSINAPQGGGTTAISGSNFQTRTKNLPQPEPPQCQTRKAHPPKFAEVTECRRIKAFFGEARCLRRRSAESFFFVVIALRSSHMSFSCFVAAPPRVHLRLFILPCLFKRGDLQRFADWKKQKPHESEICFRNEEHPPGPPQGGNCCMCSQ